MTVDEAIKNLRKQLAMRLGNMNLIAAIRLGDKRAASIQLGIEALEREQWNRLHPAYPEKGLLSGETKG